MQHGCSKWPHDVKINYAHIHCGGKPYYPCHKNIVREVPILMSLLTTEGFEYTPLSKLRTRENITMSPGKASTWKKKMLQDVARGKQQMNEAEENLWKRRARQEHTGLKRLTSFWLSFIFSCITFRFLFLCSVKDFTVSFKRKRKRMNESMN